MKRLSIQMLFAAVLALASGSAAQAFTFEGTAPGDSGAATRNYVDPQDQIEPKAGQPQRQFREQSGTPQNGLFLNFGNGAQSFDQKYNSNDLFNPLKR